jgi:hypothetical protein
MKYFSSPLNATYKMNTTQAQNKHRTHAESNTYRLMQVEPPQTFKDAINPEFRKILGLSDIPVRLANFDGVNTLMKKKYGGMCNIDFAEFREIILADHLFIEHVKPPDVNRIRSCYIHEAAHRLTGSAHTAIFFATNLLLCLRAGNEVLFIGNSMYDLQDDPDLAGSFSFGWQIANELAPTNLPAAQCVEIIKSRHREWILRPERQKNQMRNLLEKVKAHRYEKQLWSAASFFGGVISAALLIRFAFFHR